MSNRKQRKEIDKAVRNLMSFAEQQAQWRQRLEETSLSMFSTAAKDLGIEEDRLMIEIGEAGYDHMIFGYVFEKLASTISDNEELSLIGEYLKRRGWREALNGRRYLQAIDDSEVQLWEITNVKPGSYAEVRLYGSTDKPIRVIEKLATESFHQWDCLAARVIQLNNTPMFTGALLPFPPTEAQAVHRILDSINKKSTLFLTQLQKDQEIELKPGELERQAENETKTHLAQALFSAWVGYMYESMNGDMAILQNKHGEAFQPISVHFPITGSSKKIKQLLDEIPELDRNEGESVWVWLPYAADDIKEGEAVSILGHLFLRESSLELEVNSTERAETGRQWLAEKLKELIGQALLVHENLNDKMKNSKVLDSSTDLNESVEDLALIKAHMDKHYLESLDESIPMLNNKTPRQCAANPKLHEGVKIIV